MQNHFKSLVMCTSLTFVQ